MTTSLFPRTLGIDEAPSAPRPIPFSRLVGVEWAKATDTRAARWLLALVALSTAGIMLVPVLAPTSFDQTDASYLRVAALGLSILLPVVAILMFTGEWSQRSIMTTFTQEPRRIRVLKWWCCGLRRGGHCRRPRAGVGFGTGTGGGPDRRRHRRLSALRGPQCIAASFALPAAVAVLGTASTLVADWIDMSTTWNWVLENDWAGHVPQISVSIVFWVAVPLAAGVVRTIRRDVA